MPVDLDDLARRVARLEAVAAEPGWLQERDVVMRLVRELRAGSIAQFVGAQSFVEVDGVSLASLKVNATAVGVSTDHRLTEGAPAACLSIDSFGTVRVATVPGGTGDFGFPVGKVVAAVLATDANGWTPFYQSDGKRRWHQKFAPTMPALIAADIISGVALPVGLATVGSAHWQVSMSVGGSAWDVNLGIDSALAATTLTIAAGCIDGSLLNARHAQINVYVEAVEL